MSTSQTTQMTDQQATDEALLLLTRKMRRLHPDEFADTWNRIPCGAQTAILAAERRADALRDQSGGAAGLAYPEEPTDDDLDEE